MKVDIFQTDFEDIARWLDSHRKKLPISYSPEDLRLAHELAETLNDQESFTLFLSFTQKYHESFLRKTLARVMLVPDYKIRKTRGALFTYLVTRHGKLPESGARR